VDQLKKENKTWKDLVGTGVDLASIQRLGREHNPANLLALEEEGSDSIGKLKQEIEDVLSGKISDFTHNPTVDKSSVTIPAWNEAPSPAVFTKSTVPSGTVAATTDAESGMTSSAEPQIIIIDEVPKYTPAEPMSKEEMAAKYNEAKQKAAKFGENVKEAGERTADAFGALGKEIGRESREVADVVGEAGHTTGQAFKELGKEVGQESKVVGREFEEAAKTTGHNFRELGSEAKQDSKEAAPEFDRAYGDDIRGAAKETGEAYKALGREIVDESRSVGEELRKAAHRAGEAFKDLGRDASQEAKEAGDVTKAAASDAADNFAALGRDNKKDSQYATDGFATEARKEVHRIVERGPSGEPDRSGGGIWSLGSTIGMRGKVGSESKRLV